MLFMSDRRGLARSTNRNEAIDPGLNLKFHELLQFVKSDDAAPEGCNEGGIRTGELAWTFHGKVTLNDAKLSCSKAQLKSRFTQKIP